jgi:zinc/manganese transport system permease protein
MTRFGRFGFYGGFALAVTASVQLVGVYLVFSSLIIPALATPGFTGKRRYLVAGAVGAAGYALGLAISAWLDLPSGAVVVCTMAACGLAVRSVFGGRAVTVAAHEPLLPSRNTPGAR